MTDQSLGKKLWKAQEAQWKLYRRELIALGMLHDPARRPRILPVADVPCAISEDSSPSLHDEIRRRLGVAF